VGIQRGEEGDPDAGDPDAGDPDAGIQRGEEGEGRVGIHMRMERDSRAGVSSISRAATNSFKRYIEIILLVAPKRGRKIWPTLEIVLPITPKGGRKKKGNKTHVVIPDCLKGRL